MLNKSIHLSIVVVIVGLFITCMAHADEDAVGCFAIQQPITVPGQEIPYRPCETDGGFCVDVLSCLSPLDYDQVCFQAQQYTYFMWTCYAVYGNTYHNLDCGESMDVSNQVVGLGSRVAQICDPNELCAFANLPLYGPGDVVDEWVNGMNVVLETFTITCDCKAGTCVSSQSSSES